MPPLCLLFCPFPKGTSPSRRNLSFPALALAFEARGSMEVLGAGSERPIAEHKACPLGLCAHCSAFTQALGLEETPRKGKGKKKGHCGRSRLTNVGRSWK